MNRSDKKEKNLVNNNINAKFVMLIDEEKNNLGKFTLAEALERAFESKLDLVQMSEGLEPVCRIMDFGKYKYGISKKKSKSTKTKQKEIRMKINIGKHDLDIKIAKIKDFLENKCIVKVAICLFGRESNRQEDAKVMLSGIVDELLPMLKIRPEIIVNDRTIFANLVTK